MAVDELERLYDLLYLLPVGVIAFDDSGRIDVINPLSVQLLNPFVTPAAASNALSLLAPLAPDLGDMIRERGDSTLLIDRLRTVLTGNSSGAVTLELSVHEPRPRYFVALLSDVSDVVRREAELKRERDRIKVIVEMVREYAIFSLDRAGVVDSWNMSGARLFGVDASHAIGRSVDEFVSVEHLGDVLERAILSGWTRIEGWTESAAVGRFYSDTMFSTLADASGRPEGFIAVTRDATELHRREDELRREAGTDPLTALANRRGFDIGASRLCTACAGNGTAISLLMIDIDHFKEVNDAYGHDGGDLVLRAVADALAGCLRSMDLLARFGGEEFVVLLPGAALDPARQRADALRTAIEGLEIAVAPGVAARVTVSIGVAAHLHDLPDTLRRADAAMYAAKNGGRNQVVSNEEPITETLDGET